MKRIRPTIKFSASLLLVLTLHMLAYSLVLPRLEFASLQAHAVCTASLTDADSEEQERLGDCKPPKHSFIDYTSFFSPKSFLPAYNPEISSLLAYEPFQALPSVYLEIIVPPNSLAGFLPPIANNNNGSFSRATFVFALIETGTVPMCPFIYWIASAEWLCASVMAWFPLLLMTQAHGKVP